MSERENWKQSKRYKAEESKMKARRLKGQGVGSRQGDPRLVVCGGWITVKRETNLDVILWPRTPLWNMSRPKKFLFCLFSFSFPWLLSLFSKLFLFSSFTNFPMI